jgi:hypothetical protein
MTAGSVCRERTLSVRRERTWAALRGRALVVRHGRAPSVSRGRALASSRRSALAAPTQNLLEPSCKSCTPGRDGTRAPLARAASLAGAVGPRTVARTLDRRARGSRCVRAGTAFAGSFTRADARIALRAPRCGTRARICDGLQPRALGAALSSASSGARQRLGKRRGSGVGSGEQLLSRGFASRFTSLARRVLTGGSVYH